MTHELDSQIPDWMETFNVDGTSIVIQQNNETIYRAGFGNLKPDTVITAQSLTKPMVAFCALQLIEAGKLALDTPLRDYLDAPYAPNNPQVDTITARQALSHTSGLPNWRNPETDLTLSFEPSTDFSYSGEGYCYLQTAMEAITGQPLEVQLQSLFEQCAMSHSTMHIVTDEERQHPVWAGLDHLNTNAAFGLMTSADDFAQFMSAMLHHDHTSITQPMLTKQHGVGGKANLGWGLGWGLEQTTQGTYFWQWGWGMGKRHLAIGNIETQWSAVILTDGDASDNQGLFLANLVTQHFDDALGTWLEWIAS